MTKQEEFKKKVMYMNNHHGIFNGSRYNEWVIFLLTSIADILATIADSLSDTAESEVES